MLPSLIIFLSLSSLLPPVLGAPSPRGRGGGGGGGFGGLALAGLGGAIVASSQNSYSIDGDDAPNSGYDATSTCSYSGGNATNSYATDPAWVSSMTGCLNVLSGNNWSGSECKPPVGGQTFGFWKGEDDYDDAVDCYKRCVGCLSSAINAGQAVTTKCQYEYRALRALAGYKTHTCTMGYDAGK